MSRRTIEIHVWPARPEDNVPWRATPVFGKDPSRYMGQGHNAATAVAEMREKVALQLALKPQDLELWGRGRLERSALRAEDKLQKKLHSWATEVELRSMSR